MSNRLQFTDALVRHLPFKNLEMVKGNVRKITTRLPLPYRIIAENAPIRVLKNLGWHADATLELIRIRSDLLHEKFNRQTFASALDTIFEETLHFTFRNSNFKKTYKWETWAKNELAELTPLAQKLLHLHRKEHAFNGITKLALEEHGQDAFPEEELLVDMVKIKYWLKNKGKNPTYISHTLHRAFPYTYGLVKHFEQEAKTIASNIQNNSLTKK